MDQSKKKVMEDAPKGIRLLIRLWGAVAALCMVATGLFVLITITATCLIAGIIQISFGGLVFAIEAPIFCAYFDILVKLSQWVDSKFRFWMRAVLYLMVSLPPFFLCRELSTFLGCGAVLVLAALYGVLAIGKKGGAAPAAPLPAPRADDIELKQTLLTRSGDANDLNTY